MILIDQGEALKTKHVYFVCVHKKDDQGIFLLYPFQTVNPVGRLLGLSKTVNTVDEKSVSTMCLKCGQKVIGGGGVAGVKWAGNRQ